MAIPTSEGSAFVYRRRQSEQGLLYRFKRIRLLVLLRGAVGRVRHGW